MKCQRSVAVQNVNSSSTIHIILQVSHSTPLLRRLLLHLHAVAGDLGQCLDQLLRMGMGYFGATGNVKSRRIGLDTGLAGLHYQFNLLPISDESNLGDLQWWLVLIVI